MTIGEFLNSAENIDAHVIIYDKQDHVIYEDEVGYSVNDPACQLPDDIADMWLDFWELYEGTLKIFG